MAKAALTDKLVDGLGAPDQGKRKYRIQDVELSGFFIEVCGGGVKTYRFRYTDARRRQRDIKIGPHGVINAQQARKRARELGAAVCLGQDPAGERDRLRAIPSFAALVRDQLLPHWRSTLRSHAEYASMMRLRIVPAFGRYALDEVTRPMVAAFRAKMIAEGLSPSRVNRHLAVLRRAFELAGQWGAYPGPNPAQSPGMLQERQRAEFLTPAQFRALMDALNADEDRVAALAVSLLALTGARKSEILTARWQHVDLDRRLLTVPRAKSGRPRHVVLSDAAVAVLAALPHTGGDEPVFPSTRRPGKPIEGVKGVWRRAKDRARLSPTFCLHGLRHDYASRLINAGESLYTVSRLLGHTQLATTARYAHLHSDTLLRAANVAGVIDTEDAAAA